MGRPTPLRRVISRVEAGPRAIPLGQIPPRDPPSGTSTRSRSGPSGLQPQPPQHSALIAPPATAPRKRTMPVTAFEPSISENFIAIFCPDSHRGPGVPGWCRWRCVRRGPLALHRGTRVPQLCRHRHRNYCVRRGTCWRRPTLSSCMYRPGLRLSETGWIRCPTSQRGWTPRTSRTGTLPCEYGGVPATSVRRPGPAEVAPLVAAGRTPPSSTRRPPGASAVTEDGPEDGCAGGACRGVGDG